MPSIKCPAAIAVLLCCLGGLAACQPEPHARQFTRDTIPAELSAWQLFQHSGDTLVLDPDVMVYELATPLFSDYAVKLRTLWLPPGTQADYTREGSLAFPVGTVISKTFYYPRHSRDEPQQVALTEQSLYALTDNGLDLTRVRLIETRLLVHQADGWQALPYVWNDSQTEATLQITGAVHRLSLHSDASAPEDFAYVVPNRNECASCHVIDQRGGQLTPIGPSAANLNRALAHDANSNQLEQLAAMNWLRGLPAATERPQAALWQPGATDNLDHRARTYLDVNCGHCHQPGASGDTSGLFLHSAQREGLELGICKPPVAAGRGSGGHYYSIVPGLPEQSILSYRIESNEVGVLMPEVGRSLTHESGLSLINEWIRQQSGSCQ